MEIGTLEELNVKPGDVVQCVQESSGLYFDASQIEKITDDWTISTKEGYVSVEDIAHKFRIVSRASDEPKLWRDMTDEEKGALLLAHHEGKTIEWLSVLGNWKIDLDFKPNHHEDIAYRVKPEPERETFTFEQWVSMNGTDPRGAFTILDCRIYPYDVKGQTTIETVDGKPVKVVWESDDAEELS